MQFAQHHYQNRNHVVPTEESQVLQNYKNNDENTASTSEGSNDTNSEKYVQEWKSVREKKQPYWITRDKFVCLADVIQWDYCLSPISYTEAMQSNERKQWMKAMNEELASLKENETWELINNPINAKVIQNRWVMHVKSCDSKARFKARLVVKGYTQKQRIMMKYLVL